MYFEIQIVDHCNLNCAGCSHFSSLVDEKRFKSLEDFKKDVQQLYNLFKDEKLELNIMGGEPLLHPQLEDFLIVTRNILGPNNTIYITTNGLLMKAKGEKFYDLLNSLKIVVRFSDYRLDIDKSFVQKIKNISVNKHSIMRNISLNLNGTQNPQNMYYLCVNTRKNKYGYVYGGCWMLKDGYLYNCPTAAYADDFEKRFNFKFDESLDKMGINIFTHSKEEIINYLTHPHEFCKYCNIPKSKISTFYQHKTEGNILEWVDPSEIDKNKQFERIDEK